MESFSIKHLEKISLIKAHTLRIWERRYSFLKPQRSNTNLRYYSTEEIKCLLNIVLLNKNGFKISHINKMNSQEVEQKLVELTGTQALQDKALNDLIICMIEMDTDNFETILDNYTATSGINKTITDVIVPFLERTGIFWSKTYINPVQEHFINIIRQKLMVGIEKIEPAAEKEKTVILFLHEAQYHDLVLLYMNYFLRHKGFKTIYLGANTPLKNLEFISTFKQPAYLYTHITKKQKYRKLENFSNQLYQYLPDAELIISGNLVPGDMAGNFKNVTFINHFAGLTDFFSRIHTSD